MRMIILIFLLSAILVSCGGEKINNCDLQAVAGGATHCEELIK